MKIGSGEALEAAILRWYLLYNKLRQGAAPNLTQPPCACWLFYAIISPGRRMNRGSIGLGFYGHFCNRRVRRNTFLLRRGRKFRR